MRKSLKKSLLSVIAMLAVLSSASSLAQPDASIDQLDWMTGNWAGQLGPNQLEENWIATEGGSIAAMVRMTGGGSTSMFEMITIEESEGTLVLNVQQFDPGFVPRTESPQQMILEEITANSVKFRAVTEGGFDTLGYSNPDADSFIIHIGRPDGSTMDLPLQKRSIW